MKGKKELIGLDRRQSLRNARFAYHKSLVLVWAGVLLLFSTIKLLCVSDVAWSPIRRVLCIVLALAIIKACHRNWSEVRWLFICFFLMQMVFDMQFLRNMKPKALTVSLLLDMVVNLWVVFPQLVLIDFPPPLLVAFECAQVAASTHFYAKDMQHPLVLALLRAVAMHTVVFLSYLTVERRVRASYEQRLSLARGDFAQEDLGPHSLPAQLKGTETNGGELEVPAARSPEVKGTQMDSPSHPLKHGIVRYGAAVANWAGAEQGNHACGAAAANRDTASVSTTCAARGHLCAGAEASRTAGRGEAQTTSSMYASGICAAPLGLAPSSPDRAQGEGASCPDESMQGAEQGSSITQGSPFHESSLLSFSQREPTPGRTSRDVPPTSNRLLQDSESTAALVSTDRAGLSQQCSAPNPFAIPQAPGSAFSVRTATRMARLLAEQPRPYTPRISKPCQVSVNIHSKHLSLSRISDDSLLGFSELLKNRVPDVIVGRPRIRFGQNLVQQRLLQQSAHPQQQQQQSQRSQQQLSQQELRHHGVQHHIAHQQDLQQQPRRAQPQCHRAQEQQQQQPSPEQQQIPGHQPLQQSHQMHPHQWWAHAHRAELNYLQVATAAASWLHSRGARELLDQDSAMSVQIRNKLHRFTWDTVRHEWMPAAQPIAVPDELARGIIACSLVVLLPGGGHRPTPPLHLQQAQQQPKQQLQQQQGRAVGQSVLLNATICLGQDEVLEGCCGTEGAAAGLSSSVVVCAASVNGRHLPVKIARQALRNEDTSHASSSKVLQATLKVCLGGLTNVGPQMLMLDLWKASSIIAPSCPVLLLPQSMSGQADKLVALLSQYKQSRTSTIAVSGENV